MTDDLHVHLQNHWTAATAGVDFARRVARSHEGTAAGIGLAEVSDQVADDRESLRKIMQQLGVRPARVVPLAARLVERLGRLKPNGHLIRRSPVSDVLELEAFRGAVTTKQAGWDTLVVLAETDDRLPREWLLQLGERAREQAASLTAIQREVAAASSRR
jgi:hypothetical protein